MKRFNSFFVLGMVILFGMLGISEVFAAGAAAKGYLNDASLGAVNLSGLQIVEKGQKEDSLGYDLSPIDNPGTALIQSLEEESGMKIISRIFQGQGNKIKNVFVFIAKGEKSYNLVTVFVNASGNMFLVDYDIKAASMNALTLENGPSDDLLKYTASSKKGTLFPSQQE